MKSFYLLGEPIFDAHYKDRRFQAPVSQIRLCQKILAEEQELEVIVDKLREEYLAIAYSLIKMGVEFRIIYAHKDKIDKIALAYCISHLKCRLVGFSTDFFGPAIVYPRDFCTVLPKIILVNNKVAYLNSKEKDGYALISSPFGEGGRVLNSGKTLLVCEKVIEGEGKSRFVDDEELRQITDLGIKTARLPAPIAGVVSGDAKNRFFTNDHIDRVSALLADKKGRLHLLVDPFIGTAESKPDNITHWDPAGPEETIRRLKSICDPLEIEVHTPNALSVPYALNMVQFFDGRVLMTSGDDDVAELVADLVGEDKIFLTPVPIRFHPVWVYAGIRCLIADAPLPLLKSK